jgi:hypothetical protein
VENTNSFNLSRRTTWTSFKQLNSKGRVSLTIIHQGTLEVGVFKESNTSMEDFFTKFTAMNIVDMKITITLDDGSVHQLEPETDFAELTWDSTIEKEKSPSDFLDDLIA